MNSNTTFVDVFILNLWVNLHSKLGLWTAIVGGCLFSYFFIWSRIDHANILTSMFVFIIGFGGGVALIAFFSIPAIICVVLSGYFIKGCFGIKTIDLDSEGIKESSDKKVTRVLWQDVRKISITKNHIFIKIGSFKYIVVPKRDFAMERDFAKFYYELIQLQEFSS